VLVNAGVSALVAGNCMMKTYGNTQTEIHEQCVGLWEDQHGNIVYIRPGAHGHFMASFALGTTGAPCVRRCFRNALTIDMPGEFRPGLEAFAIEFGRPYRGLDLLLTSGIDEDTHQEYREPSYVKIVSATDAERECSAHLTTVDNVSRVAQAQWEEYLLSYHLKDGEMTGDSS